jgi:hypothetical protein
VRTLCIVPCGSKKVWDVDPTTGPTCAKDVYVGPFASKCRAYAQRFFPSSWCILSAKYGFLFPEDIVPGPYNVTFNDAMTDPISPAQLAFQADERGLNGYDRIVVLGGRKYVAIVRAALARASVDAPLSGCKGNGYMMQTLMRAIQSGAPIPSNTE